MQTEEDCFVILREKRVHAYDYLLGYLRARVQIQGSFSTT